MADQQELEKERERVRQRAEHKTFLPKYGDFIQFPKEGAVKVPIRWELNNWMHVSMYYRVTCFFGQKLYRDGEFLLKGSAIMFIAEEYLGSEFVAKDEKESPVYMRNRHFKHISTSDTNAIYYEARLDERFQYGQDMASGPLYCFIVYHPPVLIGGRQRDIFQHRFFENIWLNSVTETMAKTDVSGLSLKAIVGRLKAGFGDPLKTFSDTKPMPDLPPGDIVLREQEAEVKRTRDLVVPANDQRGVILTEVVTDSETEGAEGEGFRAARTCQKAAQAMRGVKMLSGEAKLIAEIAGLKEGGRSRNKRRKTKETEAAAEESDVAVDPAAGRHLVGPNARGETRDDSDNQFQGQRARGTHVKGGIRLAPLEKEVVAVFPPSQGRRGRTPLKTRPLTLTKTKTETGKIQELRRKIANLEESKSKLAEETSERGWTRVFRYRLNCELESLEADLQFEIERDLDRKTTTVESKH